MTSPDANRPDLERAIRIASAASPRPWTLDPVSPDYVRVTGGITRGTGRLDDSIFIAFAGEQMGGIARYALSVESERDAALRRVEELEKVAGEASSLLFMAACWSSPDRDQRASMLDCSRKLDAARAALAKGG